MTDQTNLQIRFERAFRGHRIHALPEKGGSRTWDPPKEATEWTSLAQPWMTRQRGCKMYFSPAVIKPGRSSTTKDDMLSSMYLWVDLDPREGQPLDAERNLML